jgi:hypothetical protein
MNGEELNALAKQIVKELQQANPIATIAGAQLPTFDISAAAGCCTTNCPCVQYGPTCPCVQYGH